jgi:hypothetical protein
LRSDFKSVCFLNVLCELSSGSDKKEFRGKTKKAVAVVFRSDKVFPLPQATWPKKSFNKVVDGQRNQDNLIANLTEVWVAELGMKIGPSDFLSPKSGLAAEKREQN